jgi:uncharacterized lipoprotein YmbA
MTGSAGRWLVTALLLLVYGCASAPKEHFYTLSSDGKGEAGMLPSQDYGVTVGPVFIPDVVDRPQFVLRMRGNEVRIAEQVRWAEPLKEGIARAVASNVAQSLNNARVSPRSQPGVGEGDYRVIVDVQRFDSTLGEGANLEVMWTVRRVKDGEQQTRRVRVQESAEGPGYEELVRAHARAIGEVSRTIAEAIRTSRQNELAAAPTRNR